MRRRSIALDVYEHAYFLDFQTDRGRLHRRLLQQPGLGCRERLGLEVPDSAEVRAMTVGPRRPRRLPAGVDAVRVLGRPARQGRGHPQGRQRQHRGVERLADVRTLARDPDRGARRGEGLRAGARGRAPRRRADSRARRRRRDARALAAALPPLPEGREDGGDRGRRVSRRSAAPRPDRGRGLDRRLSHLPLRVAGLDRGRALAAHPRRSCSASLGRSSSSARSRQSASSCSTGRTSRRLRAGTESRFRLRRASSA